MCLAVPAEVIELLAGDMARVSVGGVVQVASMILLEDVQVGDYVLLHVGFALSRIDIAAARATMGLLSELGMVRQGVTP
ncbi:HypC/HybG/HupF family hydrogenase formation chaperone [Caulobacter sp. S45]|jgi:hydrogenase expression/formation protein HypC|uniref:HypC/HybG/HupF family hydrogenase formation chaperone n=1 Tax=Caulobacter sp. S45 TaxID=1641861 RepID=UPI00131B09BC|nr:HypC/HybG/HupF family hydrogenase formation chaperone [Caulobacter sp. S45]